MTRVTFIRHGESTGNAGFATNNLALIELTDRGRKEAEALAGLWTEPPTHIITSPYLRAKLTAQPTIDRFRDVQIEEWPIQEFTYLEPSRWNGTSRTTRLSTIEAWWKAADPVYRDGPGAESFSDLLRRAEYALGRLARLPPSSRVLVFTHGQFMQAVRLILLFPADTDAAKMSRFRDFDLENPLCNCAMFSIERNRETEWQFL